MIRMVAFLATEKQKFVLYEYLLFFWKKKFWFLFVPLAMALISVLAGHLFLHKYNYTGKAIIFTGSVNLKSLTDPKNIRANLPHVKNKLDIVVTEDKYVKITLKGDDKTSVQNELRKIVSKYNHDLQQHSKQRLDVTNERLHELDEYKEDLQLIVEHYNKKLDSQQLTLDQLDSAVKAEEILTDTMEKASRIRNNLVFYEEPSVLSENVSKSKTYTGQLIAIGVVLGIFLTFIILILMKYVLDARRYYQHD
jgi:hypothetical protein